MRQDDFCQVDVPTSPELFKLIQSMMRMEVCARISTEGVYGHPVVSRARDVMRRMEAAAEANGTSLFAASPLASSPRGFMEEILGRRVGWSEEEEGMELC